jgi:hypothetical protein
MNGWLKKKQITLNKFVLLRILECCHVICGEHSERTKHKINNLIIK